MQFSLPFNRYECQQIKSPTPNVGPVVKGVRHWNRAGDCGALKGAHYLLVNYESSVCRLCERNGERMRRCLVWDVFSQDTDHCFEGALSVNGPERGIVYF